MTWQLECYKNWKRYKAKKVQGFRATGVRRAVRRRDPTYCASGLFVSNCKLKNPKTPILVLHEKSLAKPGVHLSRRRLAKADSWRPQKTLTPIPRPATRSTPHPLAMQKKSTSRSAFFNLRALIGLLFCVTTVCFI